MNWEERDGEADSCAGGASRRPVYAAAKPVVAPTLSAPGPSVRLRRMASDSARDAGSPGASDTPPSMWVAAIYEELRHMAVRRLASEKPGQTLQPTALVHEAWLRLGADAQPAWQNRAHFFGAAGEAMRRILVDRARSRARLRHGANADATPLDEHQLAAPGPDEEILAVNESLDRLAQDYPDAARLVNLRYFVGLRMEEAAAALGLSVRSAERLWAFARAWLHRDIQHRTSS